LLADLGGTINHHRYICYAASSCGWRSWSYIKTATARDLLQLLPGGWRELALKRVEEFPSRPDWEAYTLHDALSWAIIWGPTSEGHEAWKSLYEAIRDGTEIPPVPEEQDTQAVNDPPQRHEDEAPKPSNSLKCYGDIKAHVTGPCDIEVASGKSVVFKPIGDTRITGGVEQQSPSTGQQELENHKAFVEMQEDEATITSQQERENIAEFAEMLDDPYAEAKAAYADGELQHKITKWGDWIGSTPAYTDPPELYRRKPKGPDFPERNKLRAEVAQLRALCRGTGKTLVEAAQAGEGSDD